MAHIQEAEQSFYRQLFLRRYALLLRKIEQTYPTVGGDPELAARLRNMILNLTWVDRGVDRLQHFLTVRSNH
jgi:hypothetical protein